MHCVCTGFQMVILDFMANLKPLISTLYNLIYSGSNAIR